MIDLRSDTVTRPTAAMRRAMSEAEVGDDVWGDDPTVQLLQQRVAEACGKEAGLFFPTGTQSNLAALMAHCERGDEYLVGQDAHTYNHEGGGAAVLGSIQPQPIENEPDGTIPIDKLAAAVKPDDDHYPRTRLLALENTIGGKVLPAGYVDHATRFARGANLATHLDGARAANAAVASGVPLEAICQPFDTVSICFSKGLGAPAGTVLAGPPGLLARARRWRKVLGGGMRQSGILAAACLFALDHHFDRLAEDHAHAEALAGGLAGLAEIEVLSQATNMVFAHVPPPHRAGLQQYLNSRGILVQLGEISRLVTHLDVSAADVTIVIRAVKDYFSAC
jgi:threonine aldolase